MFRNEDKELLFEDLIISVYPNPVTDNTVNIAINIPMVLEIISIQDKVIGNSIELIAGTNELSLPSIGKVYMFSDSIQQTGRFQKE